MTQGVPWGVQWQGLLSFHCRRPTFDPCQGTSIPKAMPEKENDTNENLSVKQQLTCWSRKQTCCQGESIGDGKVLCMVWINNKVLLYSMESGIQ